jgi:hypothetical protein
VAPPQPKAIPQILQELWELLKAYARQETVDPLKGLGRYLGFGVGGSLLVGLGGLFLSLSLLRGLQKFDVFEGGLSFLPYVIVLVALLLVVGLIGGVVTQAKPGGGPPGPAGGDGTGSSGPTTPVSATSAAAAAGTTSRATTSPDPTPPTPGSGGRP